MEIEIDNEVVASYGRALAQAIEDGQYMTPWELLAKSAQFYIMAGYYMAMADVSEAYARDLTSWAERPAAVTDKLIGDEKE
jgi:hypothetical protein